MVFTVHGPDAALAIPELHRMAKDGTQSDAASRAVSALYYIGPEALPALCDLASSAPASVRQDAIHSLNLLGTNALPAFPALIAATKDRDYRVAAAAVCALYELSSVHGLRPDLTFRALTNAMHDPCYEVKAAALWFIDLSVSPDLIRSALLQAMKDPDPRFQELAKGSWELFNQDYPTNSAPAPH